MKPLETQVEKLHEASVRPRIIENNNAILYTVLFFNVGILYIPLQILQIVSNRTLPSKSFKHENNRTVPNQSYRTFFVNKQTPLKSITQPKHHKSKLLLNK